MGVTPFLRAAADGDVREVRAMLEAQPALANASGPHPFWGGEPHALHVAAEWGRAEVVHELLDRGADPNPPSDAYDGWSPLHAAIHHDHGPAAHGGVVRMLLDHGAIVDIWAASAMGDAGHVRRLLAEDPGLVHARGPNHATPLHFAATAEVADVLIRAGADLAALDKYGRTPLSVIASYGARRRAAAGRVVEAGGDADIFLWCALGDANRVAELLGTGIAQVDREGETLLHVACKHGHVEIVALLLRHGADANAGADGGVTPLHLAARNGHTKVAEMLLEACANLSAVEDYHQSTPLGWAEFQGHEETASFLLGRLRSRGGGDGQGDDGGAG
jgi:cytohesin